MVNRHGGQKREVLLADLFEMVEWLEEFDPLREEQ
jgi:hypothetical protein